MYLLTNILHTRPDIGLRVKAVEVGGHALPAEPPTEEIVAVADHLMLHAVHPSTAHIRQYDLEVSSAKLGVRVPAEWTTMPGSDVEVGQHGTLRAAAPGVARYRVDYVTPSGRRAVEYGSRYLAEAAAEDLEIYKSQGFAEGSLARHLFDSMFDRIDGRDPVVAKPIFSTQNHTSGVYIRNPDCWAYDYRQAMTSISPWNSNGGATRAGTLVAPDIILFAAHYPINVGSTIRFVTGDNEVIERTVISRKRHPDYRGSGSYHMPDIMIGRLNEPVPESISIAKILPDNWGDYLPTVYGAGPNYGTGWDFFPPMLQLDKEEKALITGLVTMISLIPPAWSQEYCVASIGSPASDGRFSTFAEKAIGGDSGNPIGFLLSSDEFVLVSVFTTPGGGTGIHHFKDDINQMMADLGSPYTLTEADFSGFASYATP